MRILFLCGSARAASHSARLLDLCVAHLPSGTIIDRLCPAEISLPLVNPDLETDPALLVALRALHDRFARADAIILAAPEYNAGIAPFVKNTIDWVSRLPWIERGTDNAFADKPVLMLAVSGGTGGALIPALRAVLGYVGAIGFGESFVLPFADAQWDAGGTLTEPALDERLARLTVRFCHWARQKDAA